MAKKQNEFWEKYRDPRWQRKRLEIMNRSNFSCERCGSADKTLNVHHKLYRRGADPWEYEGHELEALCEGCHELHHELDKKLKNHLAMLSPLGLERVRGYVLGLAILDSPYYADTSPITFETYWATVGAGAAAGLTVVEARARLYKKEIPASEYRRLEQESFNRGMEALKTDPELEAAFNASPI